MQGQRKCSYDFKHYLMDATNIILAGLQRIATNSEYANFPKYFAFPTTIEENALLFIGINPSSSKTQTQFDKYKLEQRNNNHPYFKKFEDISEHCQLAWTLIDLLFFRETNQAVIYEILSKPNGANYIFEQLKISDQLIRSSKPRAIIVSNALAKVFLGKEKQKNKNIWLNYEFIFDEKIGTYTWQKIPIFFCSMLTGQRALDIGSYERLKWQIKQVVSITTLNNEK